MLQSNCPLVSLGETVLSHLGLDVLVRHPDGPVDETQVVRPILETRRPVMKIVRPGLEVVLTLSDIVTIYEGSLVILKRIYRRLFSYPLSYRYCNTI